MISIMESDISKSGSYVLTSRRDADNQCVAIPASFRGRSRGLTKAFAKMSPPGRNERNRFEENYSKRKKKLPYRDKKRKAKSDFYHWSPTKKFKTRWKTTTIHQVHNF